MATQRDLRLIRIVTPRDLLARPSPLLLLLLLCTVAVWMGCSRTPTGVSPLEPEEALESFELEEGFRIELFAAEPLITDPVAMEVDENGRIYVVENPGYPLDTKPTGKIKLLQDTNGDGRPDESTVFADGLTLPTGLMRWKNGILVTAAPDLVYFEDSDGDNRADIRRVILTGFAFSNPQHTVNTPIYGIDNWIYLAHEAAIRAIVFSDEFGDKGGDLHFPDQPSARLKNEGRNLRLRPDSYEIEALSGTSQYGHAFDLWGHHFTMHNSNHARHEVIEARYLERNPDLLVRSTMQDMSDHGNSCKVYPITEDPEYQILTDVGVLTSACSMTLYRGGYFPPSYDGNAFVAEPAHNLIHRDIWTESGASFVASRATKEREFLASTDSWFRPVNFYVGPEGDLYVLDYYRRYIEHPEWMAKEVYESQGLYDGEDRGRIYRVTPTVASASSKEVKQSIPDIVLGSVLSRDLVGYLESSNIWWRRTAQRLLVDRQDPSVAPALQKVVHGSTNPTARLRALWTLEGMGELDLRSIQQAMKDSEAGIRENGVKLAESRLSESPELAERLLAMGGDPDPKVRLQVLCTLGGMSGKEAQAARHELLFENVEDTWMQIAALSASFQDPGATLREGIRRLGSSPSPEHALFFRRVASLVGVRRREAEVRNLIQAAATSASKDSAWWRSASFEGLTTGLLVRSDTPRLGSPIYWAAKDSEGDSESRRLDLADQRESLLRLSLGRFAELRRPSQRLLEVLDLLHSDDRLARVLRQAVDTAADAATSPGLRADALRLVGLIDPGTHRSMLENLVTPREPEVVQEAAIESLGKIPGEIIADFLLDRWGRLTPKTRGAAGNALLTEPERIDKLIAAVNQGRVQPWTLEFRNKRSLIMHSDAAVRERARAALEKNAEDRKEILDKYQASLKLEGSAAAGKQVFEKVCSKCHPIKGVGTHYGPDLSTVSNRVPKELLTDIIRPSRSIASNYEMYFVEMNDGSTLVGLIAGQTPTAITLLQEEGKEDIIARGNIRRMIGSRVSGMPEDLDKGVSIQEMADLISFVREE